MSKDLRSKQPIWPIALLAFALGGFGFYFALAHPVEAPTAVPAPAFEWRPVAVPSTNEKTVNYKYAVKNAAWRMTLEQVVSDAEKVRGTNTWDLIIREEDLGNNLWKRTYTNVSFNFESDDALVGSKIQLDVARLVESAVHHVKRTASGDVESITLVSGQSAQIGRAFDVIEHMFQLAGLAWPAEAINTGEVWKKVRQNDANGSIEQNNTFATANDSSAFVTFTTNQANTFDGSRLKGTGNGVSEFSIADGRLKRSAATFENFLFIPQSELASKTSTRMVIDEIPYAE